MLAGLASVGMSMVMSIQVTNLNANAGQMFSTGVDFTQAANVDMLLKVAGNLKITASGGDGAIILSQIQGTNGTSAGEVCTNQIVIGDPSRGVSQYAPAGQGGGVSAAFIAIVSNLQLGQTVYVAESSFSNAQYAWALAPFGTGTGIYAKAIY
jgi:hypothetical protein